MTLQFMIGSGAAARCIALLSTYFVHVAVWTAAALAIVRAGALSSRARHGIWAMAFVGPLLSTLCPAAFSLVDSHTSRYVLPALSSSARALSRASSTQLWSALCYLWLGAAVFGALKFAGSFALLWRRLSQRSVVDDIRLLARLNVVHERTRLPPVRLCESPWVFGPLVLGSCEICVPRGELSGLSDAQLDGIFAHELAHLERRDGLWFPIVGLMQSLLWTHPLNHLIAARIRESAELACDDRAVELTGDPLALARALTAVAAGTLVRNSSAVPGMARSQSALVQRVARLARLAAASASPNITRRRSSAGFVMLTAIGVAAASFDVRTAGALRRPASAQSRSVTPDADTVERELGELLQREQQLQAELAEALRLPGASAAGTQEAVRVLELQQAVRHVREAQTWTEDQLLERWTNPQKITAR